MAERKSLEARVREGMHKNASDAAIWLRVHYARLRHRMAVRYPPYAEVAAEMNAAGVTGRKIQGRQPYPVTADTVYRAWTRMVQEMGEQPPRPKPNRSGPSGWAPQPVGAAHAGPASESSDPTDYLAEMKAEVSRRSLRR